MSQLMSRPRQSVHSDHNQATKTEQNDSTENKAERLTIVSLSDILDASGPHTAALLHHPKDYWSTDSEISGSGF